MGWSKDHGTVAKVNADYAKEQGDVAKQEATNLSQLKSDVEVATQNASTAADNAITVTSSADNAASEAIAQANHAKNEGNRAKAEADRLAGTDVSVLDNKIGSLSSLNTTNKTSVVESVNEVTTQLAQITINVKSFGAKGDGVADDYNAIVNAIIHLSTLKVGNIQGGRLYFPAGVYRISSALEVYGDIDISGAGMYSTHIKPDFLGEGVQPNVFVAKGTSENRLKNIVIHDIAIDGRNRTEYLGQWGRIEMRYVDNFVAYNVSSYMVGNTFQLVGCFDFIINNIYTHDSYCAVHINSGVALNKKGLITNVIADKVATVIDFGGGGDDFILANLHGYQGGFIHDTHEAIDIGGAKNVRISNSIFRGFRVGAMVKGEAGQTWDNISFDNVDFFDFERFGVIGVPGSETKCGTISINNCKFQSSEMSLAEGSYAIEIRGNVIKATISNSDIDVNGGGIHSYSFDEFKINNTSIKSLERGLYFNGLDRDNGSWYIDGIIVESGDRAVELTRTKVHNMLTNFHIKGGTLGLTFSNVDSPNAKNGKIENTTNHAVQISVNIGNVKHSNTLNGLGISLSDIIIKNWGIGNSARSGIAFTLPTVAGSFKNLRLTDIDFVIDDNSIINGQIGINLGNFTTGIDYSWFDGITYYNIPTIQAGTGNKGTNLQERFLNIRV